MIETDLSAFYSWYFNAFSFNFNSIVYFLMCFQWNFMHLVTLMNGYSKTIIFPK